MKKPQGATVSVKFSVSDPPAATMEITAPGNPMPKKENFPTVVSSQTENELDVQEPNLLSLTLWERDSSANPSLADLFIFSLQGFQKIWKHFPAIMSVW